MGIQEVMRVWSACAVALLLVCVHAEQEDDTIHRLEDSDHEVLIHGLELGAPGPATKPPAAKAPVKAPAAQPADKNPVKTVKKKTAETVASLKKKMEASKKKIEVAEKKGEKAIAKIKKVEKAKAKKEAKKEAKAVKKK